MSKFRLVCMVLTVAVGMAGPALADDPWENGYGDSNDDTFNTRNVLVHGHIQTHDLQGTTSPTDTDWSRVVASANRSYEVLMSSEGLCLGQGSCARIDRVNSAGTVQTAGVQLSAPAGGMVVRWISTADETTYSRVTGMTGGFTVDAGGRYQIQLRDTTYQIPRWNNSGTQTTVFMVQNATAAPLSARVHFYDSGGSLLHSASVVLPANGLNVLGTSAIGALAGASGSATVAHNGPYGALAVKAVAVEPATGFTFDTPGAPVPY